MRLVVEHDDLAESRQRRHPAQHSLQHRARALEDALSGLPQQPAGVACHVLAEHVAALERLEVDLPHLHPAQVLAQVGRYEIELRVDVVRGGWVEHPQSLAHRQARSDREKLGVVAACVPAVAPAASGIDRVPGDHQSPSWRSCRCLWPS